MSAIGGTGEGGDNSRAACLPSVDEIPTEQFPEVPRTFLPDLEHTRWPR